MPTVLDYSAWRPSMTQLLSMDIEGVCRYLTWPDSPFNRAKQILQPEYDALIGAGFTVSLVWEWQAGTWMEGLDGGIRDGREAKRQASILGYPDDAVVFQAIDTNINPTDYGLAAEYQIGFNQAFAHSQGVYSTAGCIDYLRQHKLIQFGWQTNARAWWNNNYDTGDLIQGSTVGQYDPNRVMVPYWGAANTCIFGYRCRMENHQ